MGERVQGEIIRPRHLAEHWMKHKDPDFIKKETDKYLKPDEAREMVKKYIRLIKRLRIKDE